MTLAGPLMIGNVFGYLMSVVSITAIGRIGAPELAAASLATSIYTVTGSSLVLGLSSAMETLCGQVRQHRPPPHHHSFTRTLPPCRSLPRAPLPAPSTSARHIHTCAHAGLRRKGLQGSGGRAAARHRGLLDALPAGGAALAAQRGSHDQRGAGWWQPRSSLAPGEEARGFP